MTPNRSFLAREILMGILAALVLGVIFSVIFENLHTLGRNIPSPDIQTDYFKGVITAIILSFFVFVLPAKSQEVVSLYLLWGLRCLVTLGFMLYYEYTYGLDAYHYFSTAVAKVGLAHGDGEISGTMTVQIITRFLAQNFPLLASYHALKVFWSFMGFLACFVFYKAYTKNTGQSDPIILWVINLFPSILFWSSILGKDPITFLGVALFFYGSMSLFFKFTFTNAILAISGLAMAGSIRVWLVVLFTLPFMILYLLRSRTRTSIKVAITLVSLLVSSSYLSQILDSAQVQDSGTLINEINAVSGSWSHGGSGQSVQSFGSPVEALAFLPKGAFAALFRPLPGEINNLFGALSGIENFLLLAGLIITFLSAGPEAKKDLFIQYSLTTVFIWSLFYAFISYQNLGTAVRFKLQILPLLALLPIRLLHFKNNKGTTQ